MKGLDGS